MSTSTQGIPFRTNAAQALRNTTLRGAMRNATDTFTIKRADALSGVPVEEWREQASAMRLHVLDNLSDYVDRFEKNAARAGARVHRAKDSQEARERIGSILKDHGIESVVKSKSMVSEEIHLNNYLETQGVRVVETDLGEYIIQIAGEGPSHIIVPAIHKDRRQVGKLFAEKLGCEYSDDPAVLTSYMSVITGTRKPGESTGAEVMHIVLVDNGRSEIVNGEYREMLKCIRCGACLNACPVYRMVGGHAYGTTYPGPMGIVLTTLLDGMEKANPLLEATTLCGACGDVCPVKVPLSQLLRRLRERRVEEGLTPKLEQTGMAGFGKIVKSPFLFHLGQTAAHFLWPVATKIGPKVALDRLPRPVGKPFGRRVS